MRVAPDLCQLATPFERRNHASGVDIGELRSGDGQRRDKAAHRWSRPNELLIARGAESEHTRATQELSLSAPHGRNAAVCPASHLAV
jgi:hypothetical protein